MEAALRDASEFRFSIVAVDEDAVGQHFDAVADAVERRRKYVNLPRQIVVTAALTEIPRRLSEVLITGLDVKTV